MGVGAAMDDGRHDPGLAVFFLGFITIGGNWFAMYLNSKFDGLDPAFQNAVMTLLTAVFVLAVVIADRLGAIGQKLR